MKVVTFEATPNIAVVKYWGKRNTQLILPTNSSISMTLDSLKTRTSVAFDETFEKDELYLNGENVDLEKNSEAKERLKQLDAIRAKAGINKKAKIVSINCFPTAAGFASSASGLAALACAASKAAGLKLDSQELSILARLGSGSASRSVLGGFVEWMKGEKEDGSDSYAVQLADENYWKEMRVISVVVSQGAKSISSRTGMQQTLETSELFKKRLAYLPAAIDSMVEAIKEKNFELFAEITMKDSDNMHACMADTKPPIIYMNETSKKIIDVVKELNAASTIAAYTFDAGPNAHIYCLEPHINKVIEALEKLPQVEQIILSKAGSGPVEISDEKEHLLDPVTGEIRKHFFDKGKNKIIVG